MPYNDTVVPFRYTWPLVEQCCNAVTLSYRCNIYSPAEITSLLCADTFSFGFVCCRPHDKCQPIDSTLHSKLILQFLSLQSCKQRQASGYTMQRHLKKSELITNAKFVSKLCLVQDLLKANEAPQSLYRCPFFRLRFNLVETCEFAPFMSTALNFILRNIVYSAMLCRKLCCAKKELY